ncbi:hypothetical protein V8G54_036601 [Vigna mungo]|uniref:Retrotransposon Copia-like N-terminal domain-containing protein n=1 Tax=Vigna mungo TaxID=3915 RepID=A0AAQ3MH97_VIGMU
MNPSNPFFIHPSEGPSSVSITPVLDGTNYRSWSRAIRMALISKNKMVFLLGTIPVPKVEEPLYYAWERCNTLVMYWLLNSVTPSIAQSVIFLECAIDIWNDLRESFSQGDLLRIAALQEEIYGLSQRNIVQVCYIYYYMIYFKLNKIDNTYITLKYKKLY